MGGIGNIAAQRREEGIALSEEILSISEGISGGLLGLIVDLEEWSEAGFI